MFGKRTVDQALASFNKIISDLMDVVSHNQKASDFHASAIEVSQQMKAEADNEVARAKALVDKLSKLVE